MKGKGGITLEPSDLLAAMIRFRAQETWARLLTQPRVSWCARRVSFVLISQRAALGRGLSEGDLLSMPFKINVISRPRLCSPDLTGRTVEGLNESSGGDRERISLDKKFMHVTSKVWKRLVGLFRRTLVFSDTQKKFVQCRLGAVGGNVGVGRVLHPLSDITATVRER